MAAQRFAVLGVDHVHAFSMAASLLREGAVLAAFHGGAMAEAFAKAHPAVKAARSAEEILDDTRIDLVLCAAPPDARAALAVRALRAGKHVLSDKPGAVSLAELEAIRAVQRETGRRFGVYFSERIENAATERALALARGGTIGRVLHVEMQGPHRLGLVPRPDWFFDARRSGGVLGDLASHAADQLLCFTNETAFDVVAARVAAQHPDHPGLETFGCVIFQGERATGYARVDWWTPAGLPTWGDVRLFAIGTEGTLEVRKNLDIAGRPGEGHLFVADARGVRHEKVTDPSEFAARYLRDLVEGTETALPTEHCLRATELALRAQAAARRIEASERIEP
jgi:predicted dehydrogenase